MKRRACVNLKRPIMSSLSISPPQDVSLEELTRMSSLIVEAQRLDDDPNPSFTARYRIDAILFDAYHVRDPQHHVARPGEELQPLPPDTKTREAASQHLSSLWERGISASVCVQPGHVYRPKLPPGERQCLLFLQPILHQGKLAYMFAAYNSVEKIGARAEVQRLLGASPQLGLDHDVVMSLQPPSYRLVHRFFACLEKRDATGAVESYAADVHYSDPLLGELSGREALARWPSFFANVQSLELFFIILSADPSVVRARYHPRYTDARTGRRIENDVRAEFTIHDDKIVRHVDVFSTWRFAAMKLGAKGRLFGFFPSLLRKLQEEARAEVETFLQRLG
jgi:ketosteroid isomerase-like protein